jgi:hypothetical protein
MTGWGWRRIQRSAFPVPTMEPKPAICFVPERGIAGLILIIIVIIYLLGGFSGRFGGYGYGMGHSGMGLGGVILVVLIILLLLGKL